MMNTQARGTWFPFRAPVRPPLEPDLAKVFDHLQSPDIRTALTGWWRLLARGKERWATRRRCSPISQRTKTILAGEQRQSAIG